MISQRIEYHAAATENAEHVTETFSVITAALFRQTFDKVGKEFERALKAEPRRRYWERSDFVSDAQRRAFFAKTGGKAYERTGRYRLAWAVTLIQTADGGSIRAANKRPEARFVGGTFDQSRDFQQPGHIRTGWVKVRDAATEYNAKAITDFTQRKNKYLDQALGTSTVTQRNR